MSYQIIAMLCVKGHNQNSLNHKFPKLCTENILKLHKSLFTSHHIMPARQSISRAVGAQATDGPQSPPPNFGKSVVCVFICFKGGMGTGACPSFPFCLRDVSVFAEIPLVLNSLCTKCLGPGIGKSEAPLHRRLKIPDRVD